MGIGEGIDTERCWQVVVEQRLAMAELLAGLAGIVYGAPTMAADANNIGLMKEMDAIMCVVLGGTTLAGGKFFLGGTVVGALILSTIERAVVIFHIPSQITPLFKAIVIIAVCVAQSPRLREMIGSVRLPSPAARKTVEEAV